MNWPGVSFTPYQSVDSYEQAIDGSDGDGIHRFSHHAMACEWGLSIAGHDFDYADQVAFEVWSEVERLENELSRYIASSDIHHLNYAAHHNPRRWIQIGAATRQCLQIAIEIHHQTAGAFDITLGAITDVRRGEDGLVRSARESEIAPISAMNDLEIDERNGRARLRNSKAQLDLGAIGKGFALDCIAQILRDWSVDHALLHAGQSSVLALGEASAGAAWQVALRAPYNSLNNATMSEIGTVWLSNRALSGSGVALQGHHIIDARNGREARGCRATWALAREAARSDALSTAWMLMSATEIAAFCRNHADVDALLLRDDGTLQFIGGDGEENASAVL